MTLDISDKTKKFTEEVKRLVESGIVKSYAQVATDINWNRTALSQVLAGQRNVPATVYRKFTEVYKKLLTPTKETFFAKSLDDLIERPPLRDHGKGVTISMPDLAAQADAIIELQGKYIALLEAKSSQQGDEFIRLQIQLQELQRYSSTILQEVQLNRAFAKVCFLALQKIRSKVERQPLEEIEANMDKDLAAFAEEYLQKGN